MKKKFFSLILSFTVISVVATAINCGCAYAEMSLSHQKAAQSAMANCEKHDEASEDAEECCVGCQLQFGALNPQNIDFRLQRSSELFPENLFSTKTAIQILSKHPLVFAPFYGFDIQGVSIFNYKNPIYIVLESFLI